MLIVFLQLLVAYPAETDKRQKAAEILTLWAAMRTDCADEMNMVIWKKQTRPDGIKDIFQVLQNAVSGQLGYFINI